MLLNYQPWDLDLCPKFDIMSNCWESLALTVYSMHKAYIYGNGLAQFSLSCECMKVIRPKKENCYIGVTGWTKIG